MSKRVLWVLVVMLTAACGCLAAALYVKFQRCNRQAAHLGSLYDQAKALEAMAAERKRQIDSISLRVNHLTQSPIPAFEVARLQKLGLKDPIEDLINDLQHHPELIPYPGAEGGRMGFYSADDIRVLNDGWVYAPFDDGHITGDAIFGYSVAQGGRVTWHVVASRLQN